jgi:predicted dinucleotide-utilizing enzyme
VMGLLEYLALGSRGYPKTTRAFEVWEEVSNLWKTGNHRDSAILAQESLDLFQAAVRSEMRKHHRKLLKEGIKVMVMTIDAYRDEVEFSYKQKAMEALGYIYV